MCKHCYSHKQKIETRAGVLEEKTDYYCRLREDDPDIMLELHNIFVVADLEPGQLVDNCPVAYFAKWKTCPYFEKS